MIYCQSRKYLFLKTSKTAGTSIEIALSQHCGPGDIITPVTARDEQLRRQFHGVGPLGFAAPISSYRPHDFLRLITRAQLKRRFYNHMPASEVRDLISDESWEQAYRFCISRNPWDRAVSYYFHKHKSAPRPTFDDFLTDQVLRKLRKEGPEIYSIDGQIVVDKVCRFDRLRDDLQDVWEHLGLPGQPELPRAKGGHRRKRIHYSEIVTKQSRQKIAETFADEIEWLGYRFED